MGDEPKHGKLYVVATPIGNLADVTLRALDVLRAVDVVAAEDTRAGARLLAHHDIRKPLISLHRHNERRRADVLVEALARGRSVALVSDAGTPCLSDPGAGLVAAVLEAGYAAVPVPGASALAAAWSVSGFPQGRFLFAGFLPARAGERRRDLESLAGLPWPLVFYEAPHRIVDTAHALAEVLGAHRRVALARELTKVFETLHRTTLAELPPWLEADADRRRGEFVLIVEGRAVAPDTALAQGEAALAVLLEELAPAQAARLAARISGAPRGALYDRALALRGRGPGDAAGDGVLG